MATLNETAQRVNGLLDDVEEPIQAMVAAGDPDGQARRRAVDARWSATGDAATPGSTACRHAQHAGARASCRPSSGSSSRCIGDLAKRCAARPARRRPAACSGSACPAYPGVGGAAVPRPRRATATRPQAAAGAGGATPRLAAATKAAAKTAPAKRSRPRRRRRSKRQAAPRSAAPAEEAAQRSADAPPSPSVQRLAMNGVATTRPGQRRCRGHRPPTFGPLGDRPGAGRRARCRGRAPVRSCRS